MKLLSTIAMTMALVSAPVVSFADCHMKGEGEVNIISNSYPSLEVVNGAMEECSAGEIKVSAKMTTEHKEETNQALAASSSPYDLAQVSNSTIPPLQAVTPVAIIAAVTARPNLSSIISPSTVHPRWCGHARSTGFYLRPNEG